MLPATTNYSSSVASHSCTTAILFIRLHPPSPSPIGKERRLNTTPNYISSTSSIIHFQTNKELFYLSSPFGGQGAYILNTFSFSLKYSFSTTSSPGSLYSNDFNFLWKPSLSLMMATRALRTNSINP